VRGDLIALGEGDRVPADATLLEATELEADESLLTGESVPVRKVAAALEDTPRRPGGDGLPFVFSGTLLVRGQGWRRFTRQGRAARWGKLGRR